MYPDPIPAKLTPADLVYALHAHRNILATPFPDAPNKS